MRRLIGVVALTICLGVLAATSFSPAEAQDKDAKTKKMKDKKEAEASGTVEVYKGKDGYRFRIKNSEGRTLAQASRAHDTKEEVLKDLEAIHSILGKSKPKEVKD